MQSSTKYNGTMNHVLKTYSLTSSLFCHKGSPGGGGGGVLPNVGYLGMCGWEGYGFK